VCSLGLASPCCVLSVRAVWCCVGPSGPDVAVARALLSLGRLVGASRALLAASWCCPAACALCCVVVLRCPAPLAVRRWGVGASCVVLSGCVRSAPRARCRPASPGSREVHLLPRSPRAMAAVRLVLRFRAALKRAASPGSREVHLLPRSPAKSISSREVLRSPHAIALPWPLSA
jgi:hypothetical protein